MGGVVKAITGKGDKSAKRAAEAQMKAAEEARKAQEAAQLRLQQGEDAREEDLDKKAAQQRRSVAARRSGRSSLAFSGSQLKSKLGE